MFGIGGFELFLIVLFAFMLFGPEKIPVFLKTLRKAVTKFREAEQEVSAALKQEVIDPETGETAADVLDSLTGKSSGTASQRAASSESFAARKARHERERAEREKREQKRAEREKTADADVAQAAEAPKAQAGESTIAGVSIEELYSMKPVEASGAANENVVADKQTSATDASAAADVADDAGKEA